MDDFKDLESNLIQVENFSEFETLKDKEKIQAEIQVFLILL